MPVPSVSINPQNFSAVTEPVDPFPGEEALYFKKEPPPPLATKLRLRPNVDSLEHWLDLNA